ncbi:unnamed protein product [Camellia sinensis]
MDATGCEQAAVQWRSFVGEKKQAGFCPSFSTNCSLLLLCVCQWMVVMAMQVVEFAEHKTSKREGACVLIITINPARERERVCACVYLCVVFVFSSDALCLQGEVLPWNLLAAE